MNPDNAVVAFGAAVFAIVGLLFLMQWMMDRHDRLRAQLARVVADNEVLRRILRANGMLPPAPPPPAEDRTK